MSTSALQQFVTGLKSQNADARGKSARDLCLYIKTELREVPPETATAFMNKLNEHILKMVSSGDANEKKGGILAILCVVSTEAWNVNTGARFANILRNHLPFGDPVAIEMAARTMGKIALVSGSNAAQYVEFEVERAFEYLDRDRNEAKRHAAVLILRELALAMPTYFYRRASPFLEKIFVAMRDPRAVVREGAADALGAALVATARRESARDANAPQRYRRCYDEAVSLLDDAGTRTERGTTRDDRAHGALLVLNELMRCADAKSEMHSSRLLEACGIARNGRPHAEDDAGTIMDEENTEGDEYSPSATLYESTVCRRLISERYAFICSDALAQRTSRSPHVQHALLALLPRLAAFDNERFARDHAAAAFQHAVALVKGREKERAAAFVCVGLLAIALGDAAKPHLPKILDAIYGALPGRETPNKKRGPQTPEPAAFACIALLAHADILSTNSARDLVEPMLGGGLSTPLTTALNELAKKVPAIRGDVADALLKMLALVLLERPLRHPGVPRHIRPPGAIGLITGEIPDVNRIALALRTLGTFDFDGRSLLEFLRRCAEHFIESERADIRLEAVRTSARLLRSALAGPPSRTVARTAADVLARLLRLAVTDSDPEVRLGALASLDDSFDPHLAQAEALATLFIALHDEAFEVRELALRTVGRLSASNPAYAMPALRKTLVQLLTELEHSGVARNKEQAARLLGALVVSAPRLARPYAEPVLAALAPKLRDSEPVALAATRAIGELADAAGGAELLPRADELLGALLEPLGDAASPERRATALWALGRIVAATGHALGPRSKRTALLDALLGLLRTEQRQGARRETLRVLGLLGALDPYARRDARVASDANAAPSAAAEPSPAPPEQMSGSELLVTSGSSGGLDEYYTTVAVSTLVRIARDPTLAQHHTMVVQSLTFVFGSLGIKCVQYVPRVLPSFLAVIRAAEPGAREFLLQQLATLIGTVKQHVRNHLDEIFALVDELWTPGGALRGTLVYVTERVAVALGAEFKAYVPRLVPHVLRALAPDPGGADDAVALKTLEALHEFGGALDDHLHLVLPAVVRLFDAPDAPTPVRLAALRTVERLADTLDVADFASRLVRPLLRAIESTDDAVQRAAIDALCTVAERLGRRYEPFVKPAAMTLDRKKISSSRHDAACARATSASTLAEPSRPTPRPPAHDVVLASADAGAIRKLNVSAPNLRDAWTATRRVSRDDWLEWLVGLSMALIKESPSPALRSCLGLAQSYAQLPRELFDAAFASCWAELGEPMRRELVASLESALAAPDAPEVAHAVLNLAEFMERCDHGPLPLDAATLGERATRCRAYAKALHYEEAAFRAGAGARAVEALILINNELRQSEAAHGLLEHATARGDAAQARWYERLRGWQTALELYEARPPDDEEARLGRLRCLEALGEWGALHDAAEESWPTLDDNARREAGRPAAAAAWALGRWERMESFVACVPSDTQDGAFLRAVLDVHAGRYASARRLVDTARDLLDAELTATASESYVRAYGAMVRAQMLAELEEVVQYKLVPERRPAIRATWWQRLQAGRRVADDWQRILRVRSLVLSPQEDVHTWLKYASLCRKSGSLTLSHKTLVMLMGVDPSLNPDEALPGTQPRVTLAYAKHLWVGGERELAFERLGEFVRSYATRPGLDARLLARCYRKLGEWQESLRGVTERSIPDVLRWYMAATQHYSNCYKAWHAWAYANFETVLFYERERREIEGEERPSISTTRFAVAAVEGFFRSINLLSGGGSSLQDTLRLLTLWFDYGHITEVYDAIEGGVRVVDINTWLQVIPQLIARIDTPQLPVGRLIHRLLIDIGKSHPQALVYPLTVASKSASPARRAAADKILQSVREHSPTLVAQAVLVSDELIRVAILWHELWHEGLEEASRLYFGERDVRGMLATLEPLHAMLERGPQTLKETSFHQAYGRDLQEAREWCARYRASSDVQDLNQAWDLYYHVFRRISRQLPQLTTLELQYVSPKLLLCRDLELAVPGSYSPGARVVRIAHVGGNLQVIASKQRPRKLLVRGDDGREYAFLLKGHEDLRQDERVMQLFGLVDALLARDPAGRGRDLSIRRYAVVPLSTNSGLIGWVPHCDTLHALVRDYREKKRILLNIEHRIMLRMAPDYDRLPLANKVEVFEHALEHTHGDDLARLMWLKSPSSEAWFDRRCNYTRSLAVMSMVGYVLGLGDRHPSNLMLDRLGGKILHIDFGDCFEVAMTREKFPEKIPFRLTRMLVNAMEVTGIEGTYRHTCEIVMAALRRNRDSLMAVLEAFVYDPLLNWRLVDAAGGGARRSRDTVAANSLSGALGSRDATVAAPLVSPIPTPPGATVAAVDDGAIITDESARRRRPEALSRKALAIVDRVRDKLTGRDFSHEDALTVERQVDLLIRQATSNENLCQCYIGWCPFW